MLGNFLVIHTTTLSGSVLCRRSSARLVRTITTSQRHFKGLQNPSGLVHSLRASQDACSVPILPPLSKKTYIPRKLLSRHNPFGSIRCASMSTVVEASSSIPSTARDIVSSLPERFHKAREAGDLLFFPSTLHKRVENGVEFEIRLCPALQHKPDLPTPHFDAHAEDTKRAENKAKPDPFAPPYVPGLYLGGLKGVEEDTEYVVLFNKFSVVPHHILLVTKDFHSQTSPLMSSDLVQTYQLLQAARSTGRRFFAFYNCGNLSGASQPHKHVQLIPIEDDGPPTEKLARSINLEVANKPFTLNSLPYANHIYRFPTHIGPNTDPAELSHILTTAFMSLLDLAISSIRHEPSYPSGPPSYNVILTLEHLHLIPRKEEWHILKETQEKLSVNSLGFAGMLLVKSEQELEAVTKEGVINVLKGTGIGSVHEIQVLGNDGEQDFSV